MSEPTLDDFNAALAKLRAILGPRVGPPTPQPSPYGGLFGAGWRRFNAEQDALEGQQAQGGATNWTSLTAGLTPSGVTPFTPRVQSVSAGSNPQDAGGGATRQNPIAAYNPETGLPYNDAQEGTYGGMIQRGELDRNAPVGSRAFPRGMPDATGKPAPGEWYVDLDGGVKQAPAGPAPKMTRDASATNVPGQIAVVLPTVTAGRKHVLEGLSKAEGTDEETARRYGYASSYDVIGRYKHADRPLSGMTLDEVAALQKKLGVVMGRYQAEPATLTDFRKAYHLTGKETFDPALQDQFGAYLMQRRGYGKQGLSDADLQANFAHEWGSVPLPGTSKSHYPNQHIGMTTEEFQDLLAAARRLDSP